MTFAEKFFNLRKTAGLSQQQAAKRLGVSRQAISRWENGTALPDSLNIAGICTIFSVSADYLVNDDLENCVSVAPPIEEKIPNIKKSASRGIWFHIPALLLELAGITCFVCSAVTAFFVLFFIGLSISLAGIITAEYLFSATEREVRSSLRRRYYKRNVWLFLPVPLIVLSVAISYAAAVSSPEYGSFTLPVFLITFLALVIYFFISLMLTIFLTDKK